MDWDATRQAENPWIANGSRRDRDVIVQSVANRNMARDISWRSKYFVAHYQAVWVTLCLRIREIRGSNRHYLSSPKFCCFIIARQKLRCELRGSHSGVEAEILLECYTQCRMTKGYRRYEGIVGLLSLTMKIKTLLSFEKPVTFQQSTRRNMPERQSHVLAIAPKISPRPQLHKSFLGAFAKLRKATINFVMSVCPSAWNNSAPTGRVFVKFDIWVFFENMSRKFKIL